MTNPADSHDLSPALAAARKLLVLALLICPSLAHAAELHGATTTLAVSAPGQHSLPDAPGGAPLQVLWPRRRAKADEAKLDAQAALRGTVWVLCPLETART